MVYVYELQRKEYLIKISASFELQEENIVRFFSAKYINKPVLWEIN